MDFSTAHPPFWENLERRLLLSVGSGPSAREQYLLELINRARQDPADELPLLLHSDDPDVQNALSYFHVDQTLLARQWSSITAVPPLAWNSHLADSALGHSQQMLAHDDQQHQFAGEPSVDDRITSAGYNNWSSWGENIFAYGKSIVDTDAGFFIDWGYGAGGMQDPPGHRENLFSASFREIGISVIDGQSGRKTGPLLTTEDFGNRSDIGNPFLLGVAYDDSVTSDHFYTPGEGMSGLTITAIRESDHASYTTTSTSSGGYQLQLPSGIYDLTASGGELEVPVTHTGVVVGSQNVEVDFAPPFAPDLGVSFAASAPPRLTPNAAGHTTVRIKNVGLLPTAGDVTTSLYLSTDAILDRNDVLVASPTTTLSLTPGQTKPVPINFSAPPTLVGGKYYLIARIDSGGQITELKTSNNTATARGTTRVIPPFTNLIPRLSAAPRPRGGAGGYHAGDSLPFKLTLRNVGNVLAGGAVSATVQLLAWPPSTSKADPIDLGAIADFPVSIKPGGASVFALSVPLPADLLFGRYRLRLTILPAVSTPESNVADNAALAPAGFTVLAT